jgi:hypothetical protein
MPDSLFHYVDVTGVTLHSHRYTWAESARSCGHPERFAEEAFGHQSKAMHGACARKAQVTWPPLNRWATQQIQNVVPLDPHLHGSETATSAIAAV